MVHGGGERVLCLEYRSEGKLKDRSHNDQISFYKPNELAIPSLFLPFPTHISTPLRTVSIMLNLRIPQYLAAIATVTSRMLPRPLLQLNPIPTHPRLALACHRERIEACPAWRIVCVADEILSKRIEVVC